MPLGSHKFTTDFYKIFYRIFIHQLNRKKCLLAMHCIIYKIIIRHQESDKESYEYLT